MADGTNTHYNIPPPPMKSTLTGRISRNYCRKGAEKAVAEFYLMLTIGACRLKNAENLQKSDEICGKLLQKSNERRGEAVALIA